MDDMTARADIVALQAQMKVVTDFLASIHPQQWSGTAPTVTDAQVQAAREALSSHFEDSSLDQEALRAAIAAAASPAPTVTDAERDAAINEAQRRLGITFGWKVDPDAEAHPDDMTALLEAAARARQETNSD